MKRWLLVLLSLLALLFTANILTRENFHTVIPGEIYRSAQLSADRLEDVVTEHDIQTVISLRRPNPLAKWSVEETARAKSLGIGYHTVGMYQNFGPRIDQLLELKDLIENTPRPLLIHCAHGADRTGLASIMAKLMDGSSSLEEARKQVSWKTRVIFDDSMGIPFFASYSAWLETTGQTHSKDLFNSWLENEYVDLSGNIHYLVNPIQGQTWKRPWGLIEEGHKFQVNRSTSNTLELSGWAFDTKNISPLDGIEVQLGGVRFEETTYGIHQGWLIEDFGKEAFLDSGWIATQPLDQFADGCYDLTLKFNRLDGSSWSSPPTGRICIF